LSLSEPSGPDLAGVVAAAEAVGLPYVVIHGPLPIDPIPGLDS
jgi:hypothetical protein